MAFAKKYLTPLDVWQELRGRAPIARIILGDPSRLPEWMRDAMGQSSPLANTKSRLKPSETALEDALSPAIWSKVRDVAGLVSDWQFRKGKGRQIRTVYADPEMLTIFPDWPETPIGNLRHGRIGWQSGHRLVKANTKYPVSAWKEWAENLDGAQIALGAEDVEQAIKQLGLNWGVSTQGTPRQALPARRAGSASATLQNALHQISDVELTEITGSIARDLGGFKSLTSASNVLREIKAARGVEGNPATPMGTSLD